MHRHFLDHILSWNLDDFYRPKIHIFKIGGVTQYKKLSQCQIGILWQDWKKQFLTAQSQQQAYSLYFHDIIFFKSPVALLGFECADHGPWNECAVQMCISRSLVSPPCF